jgi:hypothetical protein
VHCAVRRLNVLVRQSEFETALVPCNEGLGARAPSVRRLCVLVSLTAHPQVAGSRTANADNAFGCVRLIRVPHFARTGTIVLLDLSTLAVEPVRFGVLE